ETSSCVFHRPDLAYDRHLDLARIGHFGLDLLRNLTRHPRRLLVADRVVLDDDADLAARLDGVRLLYAGKRMADPFELFEAAHIRLQHLAASARAGAGKR